VPAKPDPISISAYYLSASVPGPATIDTRVKRDGGSVATVAADLVQDGTTRMSALATYGHLAALPDRSRPPRPRPTCRRASGACPTTWRRRRCAPSRR
jgi:hypothetical protein